MSRGSRIALDKAQSSGLASRKVARPSHFLLDIHSNPHTSKDRPKHPDTSSASPHHNGTPAPLLHQPQKPAHANPHQASALRSIKSLAPLLDRVLVQRVKADVKTAGGIFLPESAQKELNQANVLAVGPGAMDKKGNRLPMGVATGDKVLIPQYGGSPIKVGDEEYSLFRDSEILAKINE
ncbi:mitochondrial heat shock protein Hsp10 [Friedmanniomyces endolithicus]|uniref:Mitochondrial heat shock protein Hsp10 n=1 Tax=Friedmanniomyces endolithicus TaxID=329885 RepID=A0AAN6QZI7_9PEZI|nr:mitochondrial heat shock protein Hsp10 [Friedmanniomyces endolithicus]KAK0357143.1 mitochondrial heat shock protein Hsp10 [Friedmanniomyces endolithicus]KAK0800008.1 mitochondrial heat shock protein Hsp10 [Friedmanniomyces endolithicus]KAK0800893.1 mitochondrial heat shock protein Hsp10 [Friedmanniomyces endolithicus]KAK0808035.1 mitochondrial heat shock protein Hsp10 [Friedmanniomyces endolithicus]